MSQFTTEVRFICEEKSGLEESKGFSDIDTILANSWDKIFTTQAYIFDENYRPVICKKILKHYYTREIGAETVGLWILWMNTKMEEILPYYNKLWESALLEFDPFKDVDYTRTGNRMGNSTEEREGTSRTDSATTLNRNQSSNSTMTRNTSQNNTDVSRDLYSDTPQGELNGVESNKYLTNARKITEQGNASGTQNDQNSSSGSETNRGTDATTGNTRDNRNGTTAEEYVERLAGKMATVSYSELLEKYRKTFLNIDLMVINEFKDLFMNLW